MSSSQHQFNLADARRKIEEKDKSLRPKLMSLSQAVKEFITDGKHVAIGGCLNTRTPTALVHEIIRQGAKNLTVSRSITGIEADILIAASALDKVVTSWWSPGFNWGVSKIMRKNAEQNPHFFEEWSHMCLGLRFRAASMGIGFLPALSMLGSDLEVRNGAKEIRCPYTDVKTLLVPALYPDVAILHANRGDIFGNIQISGYEFMDVDIAKSASHVIVTVEELIDSEEISREPDRTKIPFFCVDAVVEVPYGAYPSECFNHYEADFEHLGLLAKDIAERGVEAAKDYLSKYVYGPSSFDGFLQSIGARRLLERRKAMKDIFRSESVQ